MKLLPLDMLDRGVQYLELSCKKTDNDQFVQAAGQLKTISDSRDPTFIQTIVANLNTFGRAIKKTVIE